MLMSVHALGTQFYCYLLWTQFIWLLASLQQVCLVVANCTRNTVREKRGRKGTRGGWGGRGRDKGRRGREGKEGEEGEERGKSGWGRRGGWGGRGEGRTREGRKCLFVGRRGREKGREGEIPPAKLSLATSNIYMRTLFTQAAQQSWYISTSASHTLCICLHRDVPTQLLWRIDEFYCSRPFSFVLSYIRRQVVRLTEAQNLFHLLMPFAVWLKKQQQHKQIATIMSITRTCATKTRSPTGVLG